MWSRCISKTGSKENWQAMWLKFSVAPSGELTSIDEVVRGKTQLTCLYCGGGLTAKKGSVKQHNASPHWGNLRSLSRSGWKPQLSPREPSTTISTYRCDLKWSSSKGSRLPWRNHTRYPHVKDFSKSGHDRVGNETVGMQATKVTEAASLRWSGARGKSQRWTYVNYRLNCVIEERAK